MFMRIGTYINRMYKMEKYMYIRILDILTQVQATSRKNTNQPSKEATIPQIEFLHTEVIGRFSRFYYWRKLIWIISVRVCAQLFGMFVWNFML